MNFSIRFHHGIGSGLAPFNGTNQRPVYPMWFLCRIRMEAASISDMQFIFFHALDLKKKIHAIVYKYNGMWISLRICQVNGIPKMF